MKRLYIAALLLTICSAAFAQTDSLRYKIEKLLASKQATVGVSVAAIEDKDTLSINGNLHLPLQSVFKFHIALTVLNEADKGKLSLSQKIYISKKDLLPNTWSPLRDQYPDGNIWVSLSEILEYTVSRSDNNGCDILLKLIGGTKKVNDYIHKAGIRDFNIKANEAEMHKAWNVQFSNWSTAIAATDLLKLFYNRKLLSQKSYDFLWGLMAQSTTGRARIRGQLPPGTIVADKTGTSDTNKAGITAATNDIGIVQLPNGKHFAISVFVSDSKENGDENQKIIAAISRMTWDYFVNKTIVKNNAMETNKLNGTWIPVKQEIAGTPLPPAVLAGQQLVIDNETYVVTAESKDKGSVKYSGGNRMDIFGEEGPNKGKHFTAIYKYENEELTICYNLAGTEYPEAFETKGHPAYFLSVFKKQ